MDKLDYPYGWGKRNYSGRDLIEQAGMHEGFNAYGALSQGASVRGGVEQRAVGTATAFRRMWRRFYLEEKRRSPQT